MSTPRDTDQAPGDTDQAPRDERPRKDNPQEDSPREEKSLASSIDHLLATWLFVGSILAWLSLHAIEALQISLPVSSHLGAYGSGAAAILVLWVAGLRPPVRDAGVFFVATLGAYGLSLPTLGRLLFAWPPLTDWQAVVLLGTSILLGGTVAFSGPGATLRARLRRRARALFVPQSGKNTRSE